MSTIFTSRSSCIQSCCVAWLSLLVLMNWNNFNKTQLSEQNKTKLVNSLVGYHLSLDVSEI